MNPFQKTANENKKQAKYWTIVRIVIGTILLLTILSSCATLNADDRLKEYSYTNEYYYIDTMKFPVYKTKSGRKYIIVLNNKLTRYKRQYIK